MKEVRSRRARTTSLRSLHTQVEEARLAAGQGARRKVRRRGAAARRVAAGRVDLGRRVGGGHRSPLQAVGRRSSCAAHYSPQASLAMLRPRRRRQARRRGGRRLLRLRAGAVLHVVYFGHARRCLLAYIRPRAAGSPALKARRLDAPSRSSARSRRSRRRSPPCRRSRASNLARAPAQRRRVGGVHATRTEADKFCERCSVSPASLSDPRPRADRKARSAGSRRDDIHLQATIGRRASSTTAATPRTARPTAASYDSKN